MTSAKLIASSIPGMLPASSVRNESWAHSMDSKSAASGVGSTSCKLEKILTYEHAKLSEFMQQKRNSSK